MKNSGGVAFKRIFVKVFGFSDVERHALNTVFRLSESRTQAYSLWTPQAPGKPKVLLLDGESWEAALELANPAHDALTLIWVGDKPPSKVWKIFERPLRWSAVIQAMDQLYAPELLASTALVASFPTSARAVDFDLDTPPSAMSDLDLDLDVSPVSGGHYAETMPAQLQAQAAPATASVLIEDDDKRALIIDSDHDARLYLRDQLAVAGFVVVDEAATVVRALQLLRFHLYKLVTVDLGLADANSWTLVKRLNESTPPIRHLILTGVKLSRLDAIRARLAGAEGSLSKPFELAKLERLLKAVQAD